MNLQTQSTQTNRSLNRRTIQTIDEELNPQQIYELITSKEWRYTPKHQTAYACRDRAGMALTFLTAGRVSEIFGGDRFQRIYIAGLCKDPYKGNWVEDKLCSSDGKPLRHQGLQVEDITSDANFITLNNMGVSKRSQKLINKYGKTVAQRSRLIFLLKTGLYDNPCYDQLVPYAWLVREYLVLYAPKTGKLFPYGDTRAYQIIVHCTGRWPHWFRVMSQRFLGSYITKDYIKRSKFLNITNPMSAMPYLSYNPYEDLKNKEHVLPSKWIESAVAAIKKRVSVG